MNEILIWVVLSLAASNSAIALCLVAAIAMRYKKGPTWQTTHNHYGSEAPNE